MEEKHKVTAGLLALMLVLGISDATLLEKTPGEMVAMNDDDEEVTVIQIPSTDTEPVPTTPTPTGGVRKAQGPDVLESLVSNGFTFNDTKERMLLGKVVEGKETLYSKVLLLDGDRAGAVSWVSSPNVKSEYLVLKEALHSAFTPEVQDLLDETQRREGKPTRNLLTFLDTGLLPERVVFVRVRERLYEFHVAEGASDAIFNLIEELTE